MSTHAREQLWENSLLEEASTISVRDILSGQIVNTSLFYVPHSEEIVQTDALNISTTQER